jgi:hypothetical protein
MAVMPLMGMNLYDHQICRPIREGFERFSDRWSIKITCLSAQSRKRKSRYEVLTLGYTAR